MAKTETPRGVEATGFSDKKLIENCPLVITTIDCRPKDQKTYEFDYKELEVVDGYLKDESSLHESAKGKLVWKDGGYFHDEFGRTGLFSSGVGSAGDPLGHSYQYGERICDYYLGALELPKPSDPKK